MARFEDALRALEEGGEPRIRDGLERYGIKTSERVIGVPMATIQRIAKILGRDHDLAAALWSSGIYEARLLAAYVENPGQVSAEQMDEWARGFDNWATCDTLCFALFDRTEHAFAMVDRWASDDAEFVKRSAFGLLAAKALHDKSCPDDPFLARLDLIEAASGDDRNFVKKGVSWALRNIGHRKSDPLRGAARCVAERLAASPERSARWIGKDALRAFDKAAAKA
ncbi:DNA alkylation repair protein [Allosphingosinicella deserti]|nr:DNA alkylation repair protein [Sphingomonas deserti]